MVVIVADTEIAERLARIESTLSTELKKMHETLQLGQDTFQLFADGLASCRARALKPISHWQQHLASWSSAMAKDPGLRFPHRKILEILLNAYAHEKQAFSELHFSKLVKDARVGKNRAKDYLTALEERGYITSRTDGYRVFYRMRDKLCPTVIPKTP